MAATTADLPSPFAPPSIAPEAPVQGHVAESAGEKTSSWLPAQPLREDQIVNAVNFLSHPKVKGSPIVYRRSFLEKKGLTREEIDDAFRRVPDPPSDLTITPVAPGTTVSLAHAPVAIAPAQVGHVQDSGVQVAPPSSRPTTWTQLVLAIGALTAAGAGAGILTKNMLIPKLKEWIRRVVLDADKRFDNENPLKENPVEEAITAASAAATAAAAAANQVAEALKTMSHSRSEDLQLFDAIFKAVEAQTQELKHGLAGMKDAIQIVEQTKEQGEANRLRPAGHEILDSSVKPVNYVAPPASGTDFDSNGEKVRPPSALGLNGSSQAPHPQSYMDVIAMLERGEKPPGIRDINDKPPNPYQAASNSQLQPKPKPWESSPRAARPISPIASAKDETFEGAWITESNSVTQPSVVMESSAGRVYEEMPWWRKKSHSLPSSVKITEVLTETEKSDVQKLGSGNLSNSGIGAYGGWVPPPVPQAIYPGVEEAIRRRKGASGTLATSPLPAVEGSSAAISEISQMGSANSQHTPGSSANNADFSLESSSSQHAQNSEKSEQDTSISESHVVDPSRLYKDALMG